MRLRLRRDAASDRRGARRELAELVLHLRRGRPVGGVLGQAGADQWSQRCRNARQVRFLVHHPIQHHLGAARAEGRVTGGRVGEGAAEREHVRRAGHPDAAHLLGREEPRGADGRADVGQRARAAGPGDAEVNDPRALGGEQDVGRLEVAVHHPGLVHLLQAVGQRRADRRDLRPRQRALVADLLVERGSWDVDGGQPGAFGLDVGRDQPRDAAAPDPRRRGDLAGEPGAELRVPRQFGADQLERDLLPLAVRAQVDDPHASRAEPAVQAVGPDESRVLAPEPHLRHIAVPPSGPRLRGCAGHARARIADCQDHSLRTVRAGVLIRNAVDGAVDRSRRAHRALRDNPETGPGAPSTSGSSPQVGGSSLWRPAGPCAGMTTGKKGRPNVVGERWAGRSSPEDLRPPHQKRDRRTTQTNDADERR